MNQKLIRIYNHMPRITVELQATCNCNFMISYYKQIASSGDNISGYGVHFIYTYIHTKKLKSIQ